MITITNHIIDFFFFLDIIMNFRTSYQNILTGDEIIIPKEIAINYIKGRFWLDCVSSIPFDVLVSIFFENEFSEKFSLLSMLKLLRVLRLSRMINYMNSTDDIKLSLRLFNVCFFLILYIHCTACLWFYVSSINDSWYPNQLSYYGIEENFY